jgi:hypothetical protein
MLRVPRALQLFVVVLGTLVLWCRPAAAQASRPQSIHILEIDSDDADDQAEALTSALRSRARSAPGWVLLDTTQSLSMLTAALRCPPRPDANCLLRIADQLKAERFIWGVLTKQGAGPHQVSVEIHFWARGKPDVVVRETYSDNLKDPGDDTLRKIASRSFDRLTGGPASTITLHAGTADGMVTVDGDQKVTLKNGVAILLLPSGSHVVDVVVAGSQPARQTVVAGGGLSQDITVDLRPPLTAPFVPAPSTPGSGRKAIIYGTLISGGALLVAGGVLAGVFEAERSSLNTDLANNYGYKGTLPSISDPCSIPMPDKQAMSGCSAHNTAQTILVPEIVSLGLGAVLTTVGLVLIATDHKEGSQPPATGFDSVRVTPQIGLRGGSVGLSGSF